MTTRTTRTFIYALVGTLVLFIAGRIFGSHLFNNNWSFNQWQSLPSWFPPVWILSFAVVFVVLWRFQEPLGELFGNRLAAAIGLAVILFLTIWFRFDSFVYGSGNLRVGQIAQTEHIIYRWFEFGSTVIAVFFYKIWLLFGTANDTAGVLGWRTLTYFSTAFSLLGSAFLVGEMTQDRARRLLLFLVVFFGGQTVLYFGFIGLQPVIIPVTIWFAFFAWRGVSRKSALSLLWLWLITALGVFLHFSLAYLVPAAVYFTFVILIKRKTAVRAGFAAAMLVFVVGLAAVYIIAAGSLEYQRFLLFLHGKMPHSDYGLFSLRHIGDMLQLLFLAVPLLIAFKAYAWTSRIWTEDSRVMWGIWLMAFAGTVVVFMFDPTNSIVLDFPRMIAYLTPFALVFAFLADRMIAETARPKLWMALLAAASIMLPLAYLPVYTNITLSEKYVTDYLEKHDVYYRTACITYRDAYFFRRTLHADSTERQAEIDKANQWEWKLPIKSPSFLNLRGCRDLALQGETGEATRVLFNMIASEPYWTEPRLLLAGTEMKIGRYDLAKPQIDTALMLAPYSPDPYIALFNYYRGTRNAPDALQVATEAYELFPQNNEIRSDLMLATLNANEVQKADSMARALIVADSTLPYPYLVRGMIQDARRNTEKAIPYFKKFIQLAPDAPEAEVARQRVQTLTGDSTNAGK